MSPIDVDSDALLDMRGLLGLAGEGAGVSTPEEVQFENKILYQFVDANPVIRRSKTIADSGGIFVCQLENAHAAQGDLSSEIDPYAPGEDNVVATGGYPAAVPRNLDVWICGAAIRRTAGAGDLTAGELDLDTNSNDRFMGWGIDDSGDPVANGIGPELTRFETISATATGVNNQGLEVGTGLVASRILHRVRRGLFIRFNSTASALATFNMALVIGLFPAGLGQDIVA